MAFKLLKKLRGKSFAELRTRGRQTATVFAEQIGAAGAPPSDARFRKLFDEKIFSENKTVAESLLANFQNNSCAKFFQAFDDSSIQEFKNRFPASAPKIVERAEQIISGKFDLLGYRALDFGSPVDWHLEPISGKRAARKHWKTFDELDTSGTGDFKIIWELNRHQHFFSLGAAYRLTGDERFARTFASHLLSWIEQNPAKIGVNWMSSLELGFRAISWIWALHFFKDSKILTAALFADVLKLLFVHWTRIERFLSTFYSPNTHLTGEALALYYAGVLLPEFKNAKRWRALGKRILLEELDRQIHDDGVYFEQSTWYHRYTVDFYTHFLILSRLNQDLTAQEFAKVSTKLQLALDFSMHVINPNGSTPLVGDDDGGKMLPFDEAGKNDFRYQLAVGAALFERGDYKFAAENAGEELFWLLGSAGLEKFDRIAAKPPAEVSKHFARGGYLATRSDWTPDADFLLFDCGQHGALSGGHAHADALAVQLTVGGKPLLLDIGTYSYHETKELRDYFRSSAAHNTLTIDDKSSSQPAGTFAWHSVANAAVKTVVQQPRFDFVTAAHDNFSNTLEQTAGHSRSVLFLRNDYTVLLDEIEIAGAHDYKLHFHFALETTVELNEKDNFVFCTTEKSKGVSVKICTFGANGRWQIANDWIAPVYGSKTLAASAKFAANGIGRQQFFTFILPTKPRAAKPFVAETARKDCKIFSIEFEDYQDWLICPNDSQQNQVVENEFFKSDFRFAWARIDARTNLLAEAILLGGKRFEFNQNEIINSPDLLKFAGAKRANDELQVESQKFSDQN